MLLLLLYCRPLWSCVDTAAVLADVHPCNTVQPMNDLWRLSSQLDFTQITFRIYHPVVSEMLTIILWLANCLCWCWLSIVCRKWADIAKYSNSQKVMVIWYFSIYNYIILCFYIVTNSNQHIIYLFYFICRKIGTWNQRILTCFCLRITQTD